MSWGAKRVTEARRSVRGARRRAKRARSGHAPTTGQPTTQGVADEFASRRRNLVGTQSQHERKPRRLQPAGRRPGANALRLVLQSLSL